MTAQINDMFRYNGSDFSVSGISAGELFEPSLLDLKPAGTCTACWRGYQAIFAVVQSRLVLDTLHTNLLEEGEGYKRQEGPIINGIRPTGPSGKFDWFNNHYSGLDYHLEYDGGLLLADGFIDDLYVHMGFHPAWKYKTVIELVFANGVLQQDFDRSNRMAEVRQKIIDSHGENTRGVQTSGTGCGTANSGVKLRSRIGRTDVPLDLRGRRGAIREGVRGPVAQKWDLVLSGNVEVRPRVGAWT